VAAASASEWVTRHTLISSRHGRYLAASEPTSVIVSTARPGPQLAITSDSPRQSHRIGQNRVFSGRTAQHLLLVSNGGRKTLAGVRGHMLSPLNALINSQQDRLTTWLPPFGRRLAASPAPSPPREQTMPSREGPRTRSPFPPQARLSVTVSWNTDLRATDGGGSLSRGYGNRRRNQVRTGHSLERHARSRGR
jgi:hypothetical protein